MGFGLIGAVVGYQEYIHEFTGPSHSWGCHGAGSASVGGSLILQVNETGTLAPNQAFELRIQVRNFTEAVAAPYLSRVTIGVPGEYLDNARFSLASLAGQNLNRREQLNATADYSNFNFSSGLYLDVDNLFVLRAPDTAGNFNLGAVAIAAFNGTAPSNSADYTPRWVLGSVTITVVAPTGTPDALPGYFTPVVVAAIGVGVITVAAIALKKKNRT